MKILISICTSILLLFSGCSIAPHSFQKEQAYIKEIAVTFTANFALMSNGNVYSWGENEQGVLGLGDNLKKNVVTPKKVNVGEPVRKLITSSLANTVFVIAESGNVYGWGSNKYKVISSNNQLTYSSPVLIDFGVSVSDIKLSHYLVTVIGMDEKVYGSGWTEKGSSIHTEAGESFLASDNRLREIYFDNREPLVQFDNSVVYRSFLNASGEVFVQGAFIDEKAVYEQIEPIIFPEPIIQIGPMFQGLVALSETGKLYFVGEDRFGILGDDSSEYYEIYMQPVVIGKMQKEIRDISVSSSSIIARAKNGDVYTWGYNLGRNNADSDEEVIVTPNKLDFHEKIRYYYCGEFSNVCITEDNIVYVWGSNVYSLFMDDINEGTYTPTKLDFPTNL